MAWFSRLWNTIRSASLHRELDEELHLHLDLRACDLERSGMTPQEARAQASHQFGNITLEKERMRDMDIAGWMETVLKDIRYAFRQFARNPAFTAVALLSLGLGIGANTAIFSVFHAALLKSLPVQNPGELVILTDPNSSGISSGMISGDRMFLTYPEFTQLRERSRTLTGMFATESMLDRWPVRISQSPQEDVHGKMVSENFFTVLGLKPAAGRFFTGEGEEGIGNDPYAVISYDYWVRRFDGKASAIGTQIRLRAATITVIGVAPKGFRGESGGQDPDVWVPLNMQPLVMPGRDWLHEDLSKSQRKTMWLQVFARRKPGVTIAQAQAETSVLFRQILDRGYPVTMSAQSRKEALDQRLVVRDARTGAFEGKDDFYGQMMVLLVAAGLVLLIACANIANLLLARATARFKEVGVRLSLGADRGRLLRQFLTESLLLSFLGGMAGVLIAAGASRLLVYVLSDPLQPLELTTGFDLPVLGFTAGITLITALLFGLAPAIRATRVDINQSLKETARGVTNSGRRLSFAKTLVVAQVAISLLLVVCAGLFLRTLWNLQSVKLGYPKENLLLVEVDGVGSGFKDTRLAQFYRDVQVRLSATPGVRGVTYSMDGLFSGTESSTTVDVAGFTPRHKDDSHAHVDDIAPGYFSTVGIPLIAGREFTVSDTANSARVCIVNEAFVKRFFAGRNPVGERFTAHPTSGDVTLEIAGTVQDARGNSLRREISPRIYAPVEQGLGGIPGGVNFEIRTFADPRSIENTVRKAILAVNPDLPIRSAYSLAQLIDSYNWEARLIARLCAIFGLLALLLAATGLYGVLSYGVARRTNEIGIRMALGAGRTRVIAMILKDTCFMIAIGVVLGAIAAEAGTRLIASRLFGLTAMDPLTIAVSTAVLAFAALIAGYIPAARAARVKPMIALRHE